MKMTVMIQSDIWIWIRLVHQKGPFLSQTAWISELQLYHSSSNFAMLGFQFIFYKNMTVITVHLVAINNKLSDYVCSKEANKDQSSCYIFSLYFFICIAVVNSAQSEDKGRCSIQCAIICVWSLLISSF